MDKYRYRLILAPNEAIQFDDPRLPTSFGESLLVSYKLDGIRAVAIDGKLYSRNGKLLRLELQSYFGEFLAFAQNAGLIFDGEIFEPDNADFGSLVSKITKGGTAVSSGMQFNVFDVVPAIQWTESNHVGATFVERYKLYVDLLTGVLKSSIVVPVLHSIVKSPQELERAFNNAMKKGHEGLMARNPVSLYKHGRATLNEGVIWKFKNWTTSDAIITGFTQATQMTNEIRYGHRETNELGFTERSHQACTRELVNQIGSITLRIVSGDYVGAETGAVMGKGVDIGLTWQNKEQFIGKHVEISAMNYGAKDRPRFSKIIRLRQDLDSVV